MAREEVVSIDEITEMLGVVKRTAFRYANREDFPAPVATLAAGRIWRRADIERWANERLPLPSGRPHKPR
jgi:predicted DNA-binding transcriptional regulator AlpA